MEYRNILGLTFLLRFGFHLAQNKKNSWIHHHCLQMLLYAIFVIYITLNLNHPPKKKKKILPKPN